jgi:flavin-dependent dehydrogenase
MEFDVAIMGGGPAGATVGTLLKRYNPDLRVGIFEREKFPRDHVGESLLPMVCFVLDEMKVWDKVEQQNFPVKLGATYRWGKACDEELYYFHFLPQNQLYTENQRPGKFAGQRRETTFQVDRAIYDKVLLDHAKECGCEVFEEAKVLRIPHRGDQVEAFAVEFKDGLTEQVTARHYVDASGGESLLRRTLGIGTFSPTRLRNIAIWDYWHDAEWVETHGENGTYVYVMSLGYGWIWYIPLGKGRTSVGFITSAEYFKKLDQDTTTVYLEAISKEPLIRKMLTDARREESLSATKDWSFVSDRLAGENWFLAGDACGFADPILAAGLTLAQTGARRVAYSILEIDRGGTDAPWIKSEYERNQKRSTLNHIRFADFWYSANERFSDLKEYCSEIAAESGMNLNADEAFRWLGTGGFAQEDNGLPFAGTYTVGAIKQFTSKFAAQEENWEVFGKNIFELDLEGAEKTEIAHYEFGRVNRIECYQKGAKVWPLTRIYKFVFNALLKEREIELLAERFIFEAMKDKMPINDSVARGCMEALEALVAEGWVKSSYDPSLPLLELGRR